MQEKLYLYKYEHYFVLFCFDIDVYPKYFAAITFWISKPNYRNWVYLTHDVCKKYLTGSNGLENKWLRIDHNSY